MMHIINIDSAIDATLKRLNAESGGEAECYVVEREDGTSLYVRSWSGNRQIGMVDVYHDSADDAAEVLGLYPDKYWVWCDGGDGPTLAYFERPEDRERWYNAK